MSDRLKFKSKQPKPPTGLEMSVTLMMPSDQSDDQCRDALLKFFEVVTNASSELGAAWLRLNCANIPDGLEGVLQTAFDKANKRPTLSLVVNNPSASNADQ